MKPWKGPDPSTSSSALPIVSTSETTPSDVPEVMAGGSASKMSRRGSRISLQQGDVQNRSLLPLIIPALFLMAMLMAAHLFKRPEMDLFRDNELISLRDPGDMGHAELRVESERHSALGSLGRMGALTEEVAPTPPLAELRMPETWGGRGNTCNEALKLDKVALLFLTKGDLFHHQTWRAWFKSAQDLAPKSHLEAFLCRSGNETVSLGALCDMSATDTEEVKALDPDILVIDRQHLFSVYIHAPPHINDSDLQPLFRGHLIQHRIATSWGTHKLVEAERNLIWQAYKDPANTRFILLSESDVPLYGPLAFYSQVMAENFSRVNACKNANQDHRRWSWRMARDGLKSSDWRKSSQWFMLVREHAEVVLKDIKIFRSFEAHCKEGYDPDYRRRRDCFSDEHYLGTLFASSGVQTSDNCNVYGISSTEWGWGGWHPHPESYEPAAVNSQLIQRLRGAPETCGVAALEQAAADSFASITMDEAKRPLPVDKTTLNCVADAPQFPVNIPAMPSTCYVLARKFPKQSATAVYRLATNCTLGLNLVAPENCLGDGEMWTRIP